MAVHSAGGGDVEARVQRDLVGPSERVQRHLHAHVELEGLDAARPRIGAARLYGPRRGRHASPVGARPPGQLRLRPARRPQRPPEDLLRRLPAAPVQPYLDELVEERSQS
eukprot:3007795-Amphidinium_carterae.1